MMEVFEPLIESAARWVHIDATLRVMWNVLGGGVLFGVTIIAVSAVYHAVSGK